MSETTVTRDWLIEKKINPDCPLASERLAGEPFDVRFGLDRIERTASGAIAVWIGYYSEGSKAMRRLLATRLAESFAESVKV